jgi:hypothetical protein
MLKLEANNRQTTGTLYGWLAATRGRVDTGIRHYQNGP